MKPSTQLSPLVRRFLGGGCLLGMLVGAGPALAPKGPAPQATPAPVSAWSAILGAMRGVQRLEFDPSLEPLQVEARALLQELRIHSSHPRRALQSVREQLTNQTLCGDPSLRAGVITLRCRSNHLLAFHRDLGVIELMDLRVIPWRGSLDGPPSLKVPRQDKADQVRVTLLHEEEQALALDDLPRAMLALRRVSPAGHLGRLAALRRAELNPQSPTRSPDDPLFDPTGLPVSLREELVLRAARILAFQGSLSPAIELLSGQASRGVSTRACLRASAFCRSLALVAMRSEDPMAAASGLTFFLSLATRFKGPLALELGEAAAKVSVETGAPAFAANLLSTITPLVPKAELLRHLRETAALFRQGGDKVRARVIDEYAMSLGGRGRRRARKRGRHRGHPSSAGQPGPIKEQDAEPKVAMGASPLAPNRR